MAYRKNNNCYHCPYAYILSSPMWWEAELHCTKRNMAEIIWPYLRYLVCRKRYDRS